MNWNLLCKLMSGLGIVLSSFILVLDLFGVRQFDMGHLAGFFANYFGYQYFALRLELDEEAEECDDPAST